MKPKKLSIFSRLFITYGLILFFILSCISVTISIVTNSFIENRQISRIMEMSATIEHWTGAMHIDQNDVKSRNAFTNNLIFWSNFLHSDIIIINNDGEITASTSDAKSVPSDYIEKLKTNDLLVKKGTFGDYYSKIVMTVAYPIKFQGTRIGYAFFNMPLRTLHKTSWHIIYAILFIALISLLLSFLLIYFQSKEISRPIIEINDAVRDIAAGNYGKRVEITTNDEIGQLASSFNFMATNIESLEEQRAKFISDVSHELRTPMTSISGFVEGILDGTIPKEKEEYYLNIVLDESKRLAKLVSDMFEMSKMASNEYKLDITEFDANELIRTCIIELESRICDKNLELDVDFKDDPLKALGDKDAIKRVILNIMDNAIKFSYENTTIKIATWIERKKIHISIGNFGNGISGDDISSIFDRFYKTDKSRSLDKSGAGLGLSLVKNILVLHKQKIWVESIEAKEGTNVKFTTFTFTLEQA